MTPSQSVDLVSVTAKLYAELDDKNAGFKGHCLFAMYQFAEDWGGWERHPAGDEIVALMQGSAYLVVRTPSGGSVVELADPGSSRVVPQGVWHTARADDTAQLLCLTPGAGTEHSEHP